MKKNFIATLVLLGVFAVLCAWFVLYEKDIKIKHTQAEENTKRFVSFAKDDIQELVLTIQKEGEPQTIHIQRMDDKWTITEPVEDLADNVIMDSMLTALTNAKRERTVDDNPSDLEPYGLKNPTIIIKAIKDSTTPAVEIALGGRDPRRKRNLYQVYG